MFLSPKRLDRLWGPSYATVKNHCSCRWLPCVRRENSTFAMYWLCVEDVHRRFENPGATSKLCTGWVSVPCWGLIGPTAILGRGVNLSNLLLSARYVSTDEQSCNSHTQNTRRPRIEFTSRFVHPCYMRWLTLKTKDIQSRGVSLFAESFFIDVMLER